MKNVFLGLGLLIFTPAMMSADDLASPDASSVYLNPNAPLEDRVQDLISKMTLQEKAAELCHFTPANERLHIPAWGGWNQGLHGVWSKKPTALYPVSIALAATWDSDLVHEEADAISDEARALYNEGAQGLHGKFGLVYRCPVINISRDPRWGRIQECYGEDPVLTGRLGTAYVKGLQGDDPKYLKIAATLKHYAVNNQETDRLKLSATVPERMLYEYWLAHWRECVVEGHPTSLMAAYNAINGTPCAVNHLLLTDILRTQWGFDGFVVSDLDGVKHLMDGHHITDKPEVAVAQALLAGCDYSDIEYSKSIPTAVQQGLITEDVVNTALARVLRVAFRLGVFDPPDMVPYSKIPASVVNSDEHRQLALKAEQEAIVLLSNKQNFLPLNKAALKSVAVIGPAAQEPEYGSYYGTKPATVGPMEGLQNKLGSGVTVQYAQGCGVVDKADPTLIAQAVDLAKSSDVVMLCLGSNAKVEAETRDRKNLELPGAQEQLLEAVAQANPKTVLVLFNAGPLGLKWAAQNVPAIVEAWYPGEEGGNAVADVLFGDYNPGGKLPYTDYASSDDVPPQTEYDITKGFTYMYFQGKPTFPFGHGLSYTTFAYSNLKLAADKVGNGQNQTLSVDVKNSGQMAGDEIVQLYIHEEKCSVPQPIKKLADFQRIHLDPGETKTVNLTIKPLILSIYDVDKKGFVEEPGTFDALVGSSSGDIRQQAHFDVASP
jgi:beta-glucosidase